jgi:DNA polymerase
MANGKIVSNCGKLFQPQNAPRPTLDHKDIIAGIDALKGGYLKNEGRLDIMELMSSMVRYVIYAPKGFKLVVADLSNIEGRGVAYLANEEWKIQAFRDFDAGIGPDLYKLAYAKSFGADPNTVTKDQRAIGKVSELSLSYGGGVGAIYNFALAYGMDVQEMADKARPFIPKAIIEESEKFYNWMKEQDENAAKKRTEKINLDMGLTGDIGWENEYKATRTHGLDKDIYIVLESLKRLWRLGHPSIVKFWHNADSALRAATVVPNQKFEFGRCFAIRKKAWVQVHLPSGHVICYPNMHIDKENTIVYSGVNQFSKKWEDIKTTGAKCVENCTQAFSRDIFKHGELLAGKKGFPVVLPVHDELVTKLPESSPLTHHDLERIMATNPPWALDIPLAAEGWTDTRYHK